MHRSEMIRRLIEATLQSALDDPDHTWLRAMLECGFAGYTGMSEASLARELQMRGLIEFDEPEPEEDFDDDDGFDDQDESEVERTVMLPGMVVVERINANR